jgi:hypothetical protein
MFSIIDMATNNNIKRRKLKTTKKENEYWLKEIERVKTLNISEDFKARLIEAYSQYLKE